MGGYCFSYKKLPNELIPSYVIRGCKIDFEHFYKNTGISIHAKYENESENTLEGILGLLEKNGIHLVYVDCYYLPFDKLNYKKNNGNHLLVIHSYNNKTKQFLVSDNKYQDTLDLETLLLARDNLEKKFLEINLKEALSSDKIAKNIIKIKNDRYFFTRDGLELLNKFACEIKLIENHPNETIKKVASHILSKSLRHPGGPIVSRKLMGDSFSDNSDAREYYLKLSMKWRMFADELIRFSKGSSKCDSITRYFEEIIDDETSIKNSVQNINF